MIWGALALQPAFLVTLMLEFGACPFLLGTLLLSAENFCRVLFLDNRLMSFFFLASFFPMQVAAEFFSWRGGQ